MDQKLVELIDENYSSLGSIAKAEAAEGHSINSQNYIIRFSGGKKAICKLIRGADEENLFNLLKTLKFCEEGGAKVPIVLKSDSGEFVKHYDSGLAYLTLFIEGSHFDGSAGELENFAEELAKLHKLLKECKSEYDSGYDPARYRHFSLGELDEVEAKISNLEEQSDFDQYVLENMDFLRNHYSRSKAERERIDPSKITKQCIHYDLHPENVLFSEGKTQIVLDFNSMRKGEIIRDVAFACFRFALHKTDNADEMRKRKERFMDSYSKASNLTVEEDANLLHYFVDECLSRASYILRSHYFGGDSRWSFDLKKHIDNINAVEGFCHE